eukprot:g3328.t1
MFYWKSHVLAGRFGGGDAVRLYACVDIEKTMERKQHVDFLGKSGATVADAHTDSRVIGFVLVHLTGMRESSYHDGTHPKRRTNRGLPSDPALAFRSTTYMGKRQYRVRCSSACRTLLSSRSAQPSGAANE